MKNLIKNSLCAGAVAIWTTSGAAFTVDPHYSVAGGFSTMGVGVSGVARLNPLLGVELGFNKLPFNVNKKFSDTDFKAKVDLQSVQLTGNYHPFGSGFRVTGGVFYNNNKVTITGKPNNNVNIKINGAMVPVATVGNLTGKITVNRVNPYLGLGWGYQFKKTGFGLAFDLGAVYQGSPKVTLNASFAAIPANVQTLIEQERQKIDKDIRKFRFYPVAGVKVYYSF